MKDKQKLVDAFRGDAVEAFELLFKHFHPALFLFANRILNHSDAAEELVDDALYKLWANKQNFHTYDKIKAFLYITVKNACLDELQKENRKLNREGKYATAQPQLIHAFDDAIIQAEFFLQVRQAIDTLPDQCRLIMLKLYEEGKSPKEIAQELQLTVSTVNNQKARGLSLLRNVLNPSQLYCFVLFLP